MHIENEVKLDFKDVLIRPKRSTLSSRSNVDLIRPFTLRNSRVEYSGVPIIAPTWTPPEPLKWLRPWENTIFPWRSTNITLRTSMSPISMVSNAIHCLLFHGHHGQRFEEIQSIMERAPGAIEYLCIDVANGYTEIFVDFVSKIREEFPHLAIMAGNASPAT